MATEDYEFEIDPQAPLFIIGIVSEILDVPIWTLRKLDEMGVVCPQRTGRNTRYYSKLQIQKLLYIKHLMNDREVNIKGVKVILEMEIQSDSENQQP